VYLTDCGDDGRLEERRSQQVRLYCERTENTTADLTKELLILIIMPSGGQRREPFESGSHRGRVTHCLVLELLDEFGCGWISAYGLVEASFIASSSTYAELTVDPPAEFKIRSRS
jgi:hypothetical protein